MTVAELIVAPHRSPRPPPHDHDHHLHRRTDRRGHRRMTTTTTCTGAHGCTAPLHILGCYESRWAYVSLEEVESLEAQLERYRNIVTALEAELADTTDKAMLAEYLHTEVLELRAQVAELLRRNAEGRPWQITPKADA